MSTIDSREIVLEMLKNNGTYPGDPQVHSIWEYINQWGGVCWKLCYKERDEKIFLDTGVYKGQPRCLWDKGFGIGFGVPSKK